MIYMTANSPSQNPAPAESQSFFQKHKMLIIGGGVALVIIFIAMMMMGGSGGSGESDFSEF
jgi:hypothetical protein